MAGFGLVAKLRNKIRVKSNNSIQIGKNTRIRHCDIYVNGKNNQLIIRDGANLKGVSIGSGSIVGINSTVTHSVADNSAAAGNPARVIADSVTWQEELRKVRISPRCEIIAIPSITTTNTHEPTINLCR